MTSDTNAAEESWGRRSLRRWRWVALALGLATIVASPWWGPRVLSRLDFFHARRVEFEGLRYARASELVALLRVDTLQSVWQPLEPLGDRLRGHPLVAEVWVERKLPGTLLLRITERTPIALATVAGRLEPVDDRGHQLPIDPTRVPLDLPIASAPDSALLQLLAGIQQSVPTLYTRVVTADRTGPDEFRFSLGALRVRTRSDVTVARFKDILPVEADLARNRLRVGELDLRFRDQVIAREP